MDELIAPLLVAQERQALCQDRGSLGSLLLPPVGDDGHEVKGGRLREGRNSRALAEADRRHEIEGQGIGTPQRAHAPFDGASQKNRRDAALDA